MGAIMWFNWRRSPTLAFPSPVSDGGDTPWWYDVGAAKTAEWGAAGFTAVLHVNPQKQSSELSGGYSIFDAYDIGSKNQKGLVPTRAGDRQQAMRLYAMCHANGMQNYVDWVPHQRNGGTRGTYSFVGSDGKSPNGRFKLTPGCFTIYETNKDGSLLLVNGQPVLVPGCVPLDPIAGPVEFDIGPYAFGDLLAAVNSVPKDYVRNGLIANAKWLQDSLGIDGYRDDDVKGQNTAVVKQWCDAIGSDKVVFVEWADDNPATLNWYVWLSGMAGRAFALDFSFQQKVQQMCNTNSRWDMRQLVNCGFAAVSSSHAVTFVESLDSATDGYATVIWNKTQGYFFMMTYLGYPCVAYEDYEIYNLKRFINNYLWIHEHLAIGDVWWRFADYQAVAYERVYKGKGTVLCAINNDQYSGWRTLTVQTAFGPNVHLHDYTGNNHSDCWTDGNGVVTFGVPPNNNGRGVVAFAPAGRTEANSALTFPTTQTYYGASDLDIGPAVNGRYTIPWAVYGTITYYNLVCTPPNGGSVSVETSQDGAWTSFTLIGDSLPAAGIPFALTVTYNAPKTLET